jgi:hypothetical protein
LIISKGWVTPTPIKILTMKKALTFILLLTAIVTVSGQSISISATQEKGGKAFKGYFNITDMGLLIGSPSSRHPAPFAFMTTNGWHITKQFSAGVGVGVEFPSGTYMPIVLDARYYIRKTAFSPFFSLSAGGLVPLDDDGSGHSYYATDAYWPYQNYEPYQAQGGWLLNPGFGVRHMFGENFGILFGAGYRFQRLYYTSGDTRRMIVDYNRLSIKIGITFR